MKDRPTILVIEDNPADVRLLKEALKESSVKANLTILTDGLAAIRFLDEVKQRPPDFFPHLILLDINLPKINGFDVLKHLKFDETLKRVPVIVLSSSQNPEDVVRAYELHANCFLTKPVDLEPFLNVVRAIEYFWFQLAKLP